MAEPVFGLATPNTRAKLLTVPKDLRVVFDDGSVVESHALILVLASDVLRSMLTSEDGGMKRELHLPGKLASEFDIFMQALLPASLRFNALTDEATYFILCRWANEFEVEALRTLCEDHLIKSVAVVESSLEHALTYKLSRRRTQCIETMKQDLPRYVDILGQLATEDTAAQLADLWPSLCIAANIEPYRMPAVEVVAVMWPFVAAGIRKQGTISQLQSEFKKVVYERATVGVEQINEYANTWTAQISTAFWSRAGHVQGQLKALLPI